MEKQVEPPIYQTKWEFPPPEKANRDGLLAIGADLEPETLLHAYSHGIFPWTINPITWWSPDPRAILPIADFHVPRRLERIVKQNIFEVTFDRAFPNVMEECAQPGIGREQTWISREFIFAYTRLHLMGFAHSVECWHEGKLTGGVYGVAIGGFFAGESMFHRKTNASKVALVHLIRKLQTQGYTLFDTQVANPHTLSLGIMEIPRMEYLERLKAAIRKKCSFTGQMGKNSDD